MIRALLILTDEETRTIEVVRGAVDHYVLESVDVTPVGGPALLLPPHEIHVTIQITERTRETMPVNVDPLKYEHRLPLQ